MLSPSTSIFLFIITTVQISSYISALHVSLLLHLSGDNSASGSPHLNRLDECGAVLKNIGLVIDFVRRDELPVAGIRSDIGSPVSPWRHRRWLHRYSL
ncbi:unnamed protein product [Arabidopsis thaliana]|uniref:Uncharacterized protein n=2 Tax=Arabidopsis thaliana TaxID=3702 RepID=A0A654F9V1_ARATH|nr:uncharacterized protein AT3G18915 [Arabidopsis thaliana]ANM65133.1 transmembrane protein [Arabidopsis thaliana]CAA0382919.1 unnamed protein product [Arabidopsis thaliana]VYS57858.1 unnamed protein product [Arabidopsis thaliana]|eukprot:NP_001327127.1 transmembrane protein [Arabidopsis thaliana]